MKSKGFCFFLFLLNANQMTNNKHDNSLTHSCSQQQIVKERIQSKIIIAYK